jgi:hypothetical protein
MCLRGGAEETGVTAERSVMIINYPEHGCFQPCFLAPCLLYVRARQHHTPFLPGHPFSSPLHGHRKKLSVWPPRSAMVSRQMGWLFAQPDLAYHITFVLSLFRLLFSPSTVKPSAIFLLISKPSHRTAS